MASDGGLFTPTALPPLPAREVCEAEIVRTLAKTIAGHLLGDEIDPESLDAIVDDALDFPIPLR